MQVAAPQPTPAPAPAPVKSKEATIEEVPPEYTDIATQFDQIVSQLESRQDLTPIMKKAVHDSRNKIPLFYANLRDGVVPDDCIDGLRTFLQCYHAGDAKEAAELKRTFIKRYMSSCRDTTTLVSYLASTLK